MIVKDRSGREWIILAKQWDGASWVQVPEHVFDGSIWKMVDYITSVIESTIYYNLNYDSTVGAVIKVNNISQFNR